MMVYPFSRISAFSYSGKLDAVVVDKKKKLHFVKTINTSRLLLSRKNSKPTPRYKLSLTVSEEDLGVAALPVGLGGTTDSTVGSVTLDTETTMFLSSGGESTTFSVLVDRVDDPVDARVVSDGDVGRVNHEDFEIFVSSILVDPVRVEDSQVGANSASTFFGDRSQVASELELVNTLVLWFTVHNTLVVWSLAATSANSHTVNNVSLLSLES
jgi:hypothetical protein